MWQIEEPKYFLAFIILPILLVVYVAHYIWKKRKQKEFGDQLILQQLAPESSFFKPFLKLFVVSLGITFLIIALVNPKVGTKIETVKREGVDVVFAIDVSKSMLAEDIAPSRLERAKQIVSQIINQLGSDRIGIIGYAGSAYSVLPITTDYAVAKMYLQNMNTDMVSSQGTAIAEAINLAAQSFDNPATSKVLVLLSDGEDHEQGFEQAVLAAKDAGIKIITIGLGTEKGGLIPIRYNGTIQSYKKDNAGENVITRFDPATLKTIAEQGDGAYIYGGNTKDVVEFVKNELNTLEKTEFESQQIADFESQFQWFLFLGFLCLAIDVLLLERKTAWVTKLNLFNEKNNEK
ncbi:VWA domain-containing protein [Flavobacterium agricola]|uniref:VWA domain-containing protein n=1 Tax=Flavobacterium agricola TaxID=2870839 RepID=A0ABY6LXM9_9FLAO|nr:VWA domain-containing protein [Flavobacterium agricola]UYW01061.1 VWA domain-containing protein [Flavobacterium agricola]